MTRMLGRHSGGYLHVCHLCQGKAAHRLWRQVVRRQKRKEERVWRREQGGNY